MSLELSITKKHETYFRDALILAGIGLVASIVFIFIRFIFAWELLALVYIFMVSSIIWKIKQRFMPETYVIKHEGEHLSIWKRGEYDDEHQHYLTGTKHADFIHVVLKILSGRSTAQKHMLSSMVLVKLQQLALPSVSITVEVLDIDRASYAKFVSEC